MKHFTFRFLTLLLAVLCMGAASQAAAAGKKAPKNKAVYYLVCASFNTLEDAVKTSENIQCVYVPQSPADEPGVESKPLVPQW